MRQTIVLLTILFVILPFARGQESFETLRSVNFDVRYPSGTDEQDAKKTADYLESDFEYLRAKLGINPGKRYEVWIYGSVAEYTAGAGLRKPGRGIHYHVGVIHVEPIALLEGKNLFAQALSFALVNALLSGPGDAGCPRWLRESFAVYHCGIMANLTSPVGVRLLFFSDLDQNIQQYPDPPQRDEVDYLLGMTMQFFVETYGEEKPFSLYRKFDGRKSVEDLFSEVFGVEFVAVEKSWARYMDTKIEKLKSPGR